MSEFAVQKKIYICFQVKFSKDSNVISRQGKGLKG